MTLMHRLMEIVGIGHMPTKHEEQIRKLERASEANHRAHERFREQLCHQTSEAIFKEIDHIIAGSRHNGADH